MAKVTILLIHEICMQWMIYIIRFLNIVILSTSHILKSVTHDLSVTSKHTDCTPFAIGSTAWCEIRHDRVESEYFCPPPPNYWLLCLSCGMPPNAGKRKSVSLSRGCSTTFGRAAVADPNGFCGGHSTGSQHINGGINGGILRAITKGIAEHRH